MLKEQEIIQGAKKLLHYTMEQLNEQIRRLRSSLYFMECDVQDKNKELRIDEQNLNMTETSLNLSKYHGFVPLDAGYVVSFLFQLFKHRQLKYHLFPNNKIQNN